MRKSASKRDFLDRLDDGFNNNPGKMLVGVFALNFLLAIVFYGLIILMIVLGIKWII